MVLKILLALVSATTLFSLILFLDEKLKNWWGEKYSFTKGGLLLFSLLSALLQIRFFFNIPLLLYGIDGGALLLCLLQHRAVWIRFQYYKRVLFTVPWRQKEYGLFVLYLLLAYLFLLSIFSVQGWDWDSQIFHLARPFLYLNEGTLFTTHFSDPRQVVWPMGGDILFYLFTQHGSDIGTGFISFLFTIFLLAVVYESLEPKIGRQKALTLVFLTSAIPIHIYGATTVKGDVMAIAVFVMMWLFFLEYRQNHKGSDLFLLLLAFFFGLSIKLTFVIAAAFSLIAFLFLEYHSFKRPKLKSFLLCIPLFLLLSQLHLYLFNIIQFGHPLGPTMGLIPPPTPLLIFQNFFKYHLETIDFILPLSSIGIPFLDTFLSQLYNHTIGFLTNDAPWQFQYFPQEMHASYGPFAFFLLILGIYRTAFGKSERLYKLFSWAALGTIFFIIFKFERDENISIVRYFAPPIIASLVVLPKVYGSRFLNNTKFIRISSLFLFLICCVINYAKPLVAYHPKAIPWYSYAFSNRDLLAKEKHFFDNRLEVFRKEIKANDRVLILSKPNVWMYPYYKYSQGASIRLGYYKWDHEMPLQNYTLIICEERNCIQALNRNRQLVKIWESSTDLPRPAAYYRWKRGP